MPKYPIPLNPALPYQAASLEVDPYPLPTARFGDVHEGKLHLVLKGGCPLEFPVTLGPPVVALLLRHNGLPPGQRLDDVTVHLTFTPPSAPGTPGFGPVTHR